MLYNNETIQKAMSIARHAYSDRIDKKGRSLFLMACTKAEMRNTENEVIIDLLARALSETDMTLEDVKKTGFEETIIKALQSKKQSQKKNANEHKIESLTA